MKIVTANELKTCGVTSLEEGLKDHPELMITVRGKEKYMVLSLEHYHYLREMELEAALFEARQDVASGKTIRESAEAHVQRVFE